MICIKKPEILLPKKNIDLSKWSVIACDQFTSQPKYWQELENATEGEYSSLQLIFPEVYLSKNNEEYISKINKNMRDYLSADIFDKVDDYILVERVLPNGKTRLGLMLCVDLDAYEYTQDNNALIKATERTVVERLPIRIDIRKNAQLELPHIMLLMDDDKKDIIEPMFADKENLELLYATELNMGGGSIKGYRVCDSIELEEKLADLISPQRLSERYNSDKEMLFAVGDGNHSLATAKECWNLIKTNLTETEKQNHPARYALCELVNLHDDSLEFEPIHRVVLGADENFVYEMTKALDGEGRLIVEYEGNSFKLNCNANPSDAIKDIQDFIDEAIGEDSNISIDYIHGDAYLREVAQREKAVAIFMPTLSKDSLFNYVIRRGVLPRKAFSMGEAEDKRYYLEVRKIIK